MRRAAAVVWSLCLIAAVGVISLARILPGGSQFAYVSTRAGGTQVFLHDVLTGADFSLSRGHRSDTNPCWLDANHLLIQTGYGIVITDIFGAHRRGIPTSQNRIFRPICDPGSPHITFVDTQSVDMMFPPVYQLDSGWNQLSAVPHRTTTFLDSQPVLSPDGTSFLYVADAMGEGRRLMREQIAEGSSRLVYQAASSIIEPAWSPDMHHIAFATGADLWMIDADGQNPVNLTTTLHSDVRQWAWSPDSLHLAFAIFSGGVNNILVSSPDTGALINLTPHFGMCYDPRWGLDSRTLLITCQDGQNLNIDIYAADIVTHDMTRLTSAPARDFAPVWKP